MRGAAPQKHNAFKIEFAKRALVRALDEVAKKPAGGAA